MDFVQSIDQVTIVGTGLLGGSLGLALKARGHAARIVGVGRRQQTLDKAIACGCIDEGSLSLADALEAGQSKGVNLVVAATALGSFPAIFKEIARHDHDRLVVTDVGSVKGYVLSAAADAGMHMGRFVGSHPMAGSEQQGPEAAMAELFEGRPCIVTTDNAEQTPAGARSDTLSLVEQVWQFVGMDVLKMTAAEHDMKVAIASHLPHALASMMIQLVGEQEAFDVASTGLADTTRVASGDAGIWADIFSTNRGALLDSIDELEAAVNQLRAKIDKDDRQASFDWLEEMRLARNEWIESRRAQERRSDHKGQD